MVVNHSQTPVFQLRDGGGREGSPFLLTPSHVSLQEQLLRADLTAKQRNNPQISQHARTRARLDALLGHRTDFISLNTPKSRHLLSNPAIKSTLNHITGQNATRSEWRS